MKKILSALFLLFISNVIFAEEEKEKCMPFKEAESRIIQQVTFGIKLQKEINALKKENEELREMAVFYKELSKKMYHEEFK